MRAVPSPRVLKERLISLLPTKFFSRSGTRFLNQKIPPSGYRFGVPYELMCTIVVYQRWPGKPFISKGPLIFRLFSMGWRSGSNSHPRFAGCHQSRNPQPAKNRRTPNHNAMLLVALELGQSSVAKLREISPIRHHKIHRLNNRFNLSLSNGDLS